MNASFKMSTKLADKVPSVKGSHLQESFGVMVCLGLVQSAQQDGSNLREVHITQSTQWKRYSIENLKKTHLKKEYDDQKDAIGSEEDAGLFEGATVAEDGDDQDEGTNCN